MTDLATIFILDDDREFGELLSEVITQTGKQVEFEQSASSFLSSTRPSSGVLILDLIMPEMDGIEVIRALAENNE
ncbi:MAG: FixJ family two-component response regulator [Gammaproteobacteria bacterium]|jgi:FixJ family two-component response regulator